MKDNENTWINFDELISIANEINGINKPIKSDESIEELAKALKSADIETIIEFIESVQGNYIALEKKAELAACGEWLSYGENKPIKGNEYLIKLENDEIFLVYYGSWHESEDCNFFYKESDCAVDFKVIMFAEIKE